MKCVLKKTLVLIGRVHNVNGYNSGSQKLALLFILTQMFNHFRFKSAAILSAAPKKSVVEMALTNNIHDIAHRNDSLPNDGVSQSLITPTTNGPKPKPIRLITRNKMAEVIARCAAGTSR